MRSRYSAQVIDPPSAAGRDEAAVYSRSTRPWPARQPLSPIQRKRVHTAVAERVRAVMGAHGYVKLPASGALDPGVERAYHEREQPRAGCVTDGPSAAGGVRIEATQRGLSLGGLCDLLERLLKDMAGGLHADLIGGANATRADRMVNTVHPRLTYREALAALNRRGFQLRFGAELQPGAAAALLHHCGNLPIMITHHPASERWFHGKLDAADPHVVACVDYILPFAGSTFSGALHKPIDAGPDHPMDDDRSGFDLAVERLLQYVIGQDSGGDATA